MQILKTITGAVTTVQRAEVEKVHVIQGHKIEELPPKEKLKQLEAEIHALENKRFELGANPTNSEVQLINKELQTRRAARAGLLGRVKVPTGNKGVLGKVKAYSKTLFTHLTQQLVDIRYNPQCANALKANYIQIFRNKETGVITATKNGKPLTYLELVKVTEAQVERYERLLNEPGANTKELTGLLNDAKVLLDKLKENQKVIEHHVDIAGKKVKHQKVGMTGAKRIQLQESYKTAEEFQNALAAALPGHEINVKQTGVGEHWFAGDPVVQVKIDGKTYNLDQLTKLLNKPKILGDCYPAKTRGAHHLTTIGETLGMVKKGGAENEPDVHRITIMSNENVKGVKRFFCGDKNNKVENGSTSTATKVYYFLIIAKKNFFILLRNVKHEMTFDYDMKEEYYTSINQVYNKDKGPKGPEVNGNEVLNKITDLTKKIFKDEVKIDTGNSNSVVSSHRSLLGKVNFIVRDENGTLSLQAFREKIGAKLQEKMAAQAELETDSEEYHALSKEIMEINQLLAQLDGKRTANYLGVGQEVALAAYRTIDGLGEGLRMGGVGVKRFYRRHFTNAGATEKFARKLIRSENAKAAKAEKASGAKFKFRSLKVAEKNVMRAAFDLRYAIGNKSTFVDKCKKLIDPNAAGYTPETVAAAKAIIKRNNNLMKKALEKGDIEAIHFLIDNGLISHISRGMLKKLGEMPGITTDQRKEILAKLFKNGPKEVGHEHILGSLKKSFLRFITNATNQSGRELVMDHILEHVGKKFAEELLLETMKEQGWDPNNADFKNKLLTNEWNPIKRAGEMIVPDCLLMAAKIGTPALLAAAFGVNGNESHEELGKKMEPYLFLPSSSGKLLLSYAAEGTDAKFFMCVNLASEAAMRSTPIVTRKDEATGGVRQVEKKFKDSKTMTRAQYKQAMLKQLQKQLKSGQLYMGKKDFDQVAKAVSILAQEFPELTYMLKALAKRDEFGDVGPNYGSFLKMIRKDIDRELVNLSNKSMCNAHDNRGMSALRLMNPGMAEEADLMLEDYINKDVPSGGERVKVFCFAKGSCYYDVLRNPQHGFFVGATFVGKGIGCTGSVEATAAVGDHASFVVAQNAFQDPLIFCITLFALGAWAIKRSVIGRMVANAKGFNKKLTKFDPSKAPDMLRAFDAIETGKKTGVAIPESNVQPSEASAPAVGAESKTEGTKVAEGETKIHKGDNKAKEIKKMMKKQNAEDVLTELKKIQLTEGTQLSDSQKNHLLEGFDRLKRFPGNTREEILVEMFRLMSPDGQAMEAVIDLQLQRGKPGKEALQKVLGAQIAKWKKDEGFPPPEMYEAALLAAAKMADLGLYKELLTLKNGKLIFAARDGWIKAGGDHNSLLHAIILGKLSESNEHTAQVAKAVFDDMVEGNKLHLELDPLVGNKRSLNPFDITTTEKSFIKRLINGKQKVQNLMAPTQAAALDEAFGLDPTRPGSFTYIVKMRDKKDHRELINEIALVLPAKLIINLAAEVVSHTMTHAAAATGMMHGGPVAAVAAAAATVYFIECNVILWGGTIGVAGGKMLTHASSNMDNAMRGYSETVTQLGTSQVGMEEAIAFRKKLEARELSPEEKKQFDTYMAAFMHEAGEAIGKGIEAAKQANYEAGSDPEITAKLKMAEEKFKELFANPPVKLRAIKSLMANLDLPPSVVSIMQRPFNDMVKAGVNPVFSGMPKASTAAAASPANATAATASVSPANTNETAATPPSSPAPSSQELPKVVTRKLTPRPKQASASTPTNAPTGATTTNQ